MQDDDNSDKKKLEEDSKQDSFLREEATNHFDSPDQLDHLLVVTNRRLWLSLFGLFVFTFAILLWSIFGTISVQVFGKGIVINEKGFFSILAKNEGMIKDITVTSGEQVKKDELVIDILNEQLELQMLIKKTKIQGLENSLISLKKANKEGIEERNRIIQQEIDTEEFIVQDKKNSIAALKKNLIVKQQLYEEGIVSKSAIGAIESKITAHKLTIEKKKGVLANLKIKLGKSYLSSGSTRAELAQLNEELKVLELRKDFASVESPEDGKVLEVLVNPGDIVKSGHPLVWLERPMKKNETHNFLGYVPVSLGKKIKEGDSVQIELSSVNAQEYGTILGTVKEISQFAMSKENITKKIYNSGLVKLLTSDQDAVLQVVIEPILDPNTPTGYKWTSGTGYPHPISTGTVCHIRVTVEKIRPLYYVLPLWKLRNIGEKIFDLKDPKVSDKVSYNK